ncbi:MAG: SDR family NAD(P)-dependent oxidoreductase [Pseudomonadales bacterium]|nr:SDR family NAD(P)-dependent oxidoreductase [Pseudomonadales bacterium]
MKEFSNKIAVITGGGTGMGRELACCLTALGANVAICDVSAENMAETVSLASVAEGCKITTHVCDVSSEEQMNNFRSEVVDQHGTDYINILFNNAGIGGGGEFVNGDRDAWERTFGVCWYGVYYGCRAFMDLLVAADEGYIVNTSSVNGFWASIGPDVSHTSYAAAKFAVKGFTEALVTDSRLNAPHVKCSVVMPGHIGTSIALNSSVVHGQGSALEMRAEDVAAVRERLLAAGAPVDNVPDDHIREMMHQRAIAFRDKAPTSAKEAANIILDGVREERWRILVGDDAYHLDALVRRAPEEAYEPDFVAKMHDAGHFDELVPTLEGPKQ